MNIISKSWLLVNDQLALQKQWLTKKFWSILNTTLMSTHSMLFFFLNKKDYPRIINKYSSLTLVLLNKWRGHAQFWFSANQITWSRFLI